MAAASRQSVRRPVGQDERAGFTLVELLLVMFILSVLVALVVGVGSKVIEHSRKTETMTVQDKLSAAIEAYKRATGSYPSDDGNYTMNSLIRKLRGEEIEDEETRKAVDKETKPYLRGSVVSGVDGFGEAMRWYGKGGLGGKPVIVSAGPDGDFGDGDAARRRDNIRSDTRGTSGTLE